MPARRRAEDEVRPPGHQGIPGTGGRFAPGHPELVSVYDYALSPFGGADAGRSLASGDSPHVSSIKARFARSSS